VWQRTMGVPHGLMSVLRWGVLGLFWVSVSVSGRWVDAAEYPFRSSGVDGQQVAVAEGDGPSWTVVVFLGTECPLAKLYGPRLQRLADELRDQPVQLIGVVSNQQDSVDEIRAYAEEHGIRFPIVKDHENRIADQYGAERTPEVFVLDHALRVRYHGRIDDQYLPGIARTAPQREDLRQAIQELLAGQPVSLPETVPQGCVIGRVMTPASNAPVTFCNQVVRILNQACVECHRAGEIGPFALIDYDEVVGWGEMICEVVSQGRMPPWHADPAHGSFRNERQLSDEQKQQLRDWVDAGAPYGDPSELPEPPQFVAGWQFSREPDVVISMRDRPFLVPADGTVEYQYFVVDPRFTEDRWVTAAQVIPGNAAVVHHSIVFIRPPDGARFRGVGWLGAYVPGQRVFELPPGRARLVPAGSKLVFQQHYTPNGKAQSDVTRVGLLFGTEADVTHEVFTVVGIDQEFEIPPGDPSFEVQGSISRFPRDGELLAIMPHMHLRGTSFECVIEYADDDELAGRRDAGAEAASDRTVSPAIASDVDPQVRCDTALRVPQYDFNWQHVYELTEPISLRGVRDIRFTATFDNSAQNPFNPDPKETVMWGDQTWEEMAVVFFAVAEPRFPTQDSARATGKSAAVEDQTKRERVAAFVRDFFDRFDQNRDGFVDRHETPLAFRKFAFGQFDADGNQRLTREEIEASARNRF
jgi:peroxiredoxin